MKHFQEIEFKCPCGCGLGFASMDEKLITKLDMAREWAGVPFHITSSIRCPKHNHKVKGKVTSSHLTGKAVDIYCDNSNTRYKIIKGLIMTGFNRIGVGGHFIHTDIDGEKTQKIMWVYG